MSTNVDDGGTRVRDWMARMVAYEGRCWRWNRAKQLVEADEDYRSEWRDPALAEAIRYLYEQRRSPEESSSSYEPSDMDVVLDLKDGALAADVGRRVRTAIEAGGEDGEIASEVGTSRRVVWLFRSLFFDPAGSPRG